MTTWFSYEQHQNVMTMWGSLHAITALHKMLNPDWSAARGYYRVKDLKSGEWSDLDGKPKSAVCTFCRKTLETSRKQRVQQKLPHQIEPFKDQTKILAHVQPCALRYLREQLSLWSTGQMRADEHEVVKKWRKERLTPRRRDDMWGAFEMHNRADDLVDLARVFDVLPQPPGSDMALNLEVALVAISRLYEQEI